MLVISVVLYPSLPEELPRHYDINGNVDAMWPKLYAVLMAPVVTSLVVILMQVLPRFDPKRESYEKFQPTYERFQVAFTAFFLGLHIITLTQYDNPHGVSRLVLLGIGLFFAAIGNDMGRYRQTWFMGIRTPWTLADERVWKQTHRMAARWFVIVGIAAAVMALLLPLQAAGIISFALLMILVVGVYAYSYLLFRRTNP